MSGIFPKAHNQLHLLQSWYFLCPVYTITASTEAVLSLSVSMNISWHQLRAPLLHYKHFQPRRTAAEFALLQYCIDCDKCYEGKEYTFLIAFLCSIFEFDEITANCCGDENIC